MKKKEKMVACIIMVVMLIIGAAGYSMVEKKPDIPIRLLYKTNAGKVLFDHNMHSTEYDIGCIDCHHYYEEGEGMPLSCIECHYKDGDNYSRAEAFHSQCLDCHKEQETGPVKCGECHVM
ncbi:MAG: cytochrome c3 family protein [Proteobacteria bacterium]|nr:cytochrome c3 family protein [Pseudomonadota bacterium]